MLELRAEVQKIIDKFTVVRDELQHLHWNAVQWFGHEKLDEGISLLTDCRDRFAEIFLAAIPDLHVQGVSAGDRVPYCEFSDGGADYELMRSLATSRLTELINDVCLLNDSQELNNLSFHKVYVQNMLGDIAEQLARYTFYKWRRFSQS